MYSQAGEALSACSFWSHTLLCPTLLLGPGEDENVLGYLVFPSLVFCLIKNRKDRTKKPSVCVYRLFVAVCACGIAWGVALAIWDIMIASGQYYKARVENLVSTVNSILTQNGP